MRWFLVVLAGCAPATTAPCQDHIERGDLVITEVFGRYKGTGGDRGRQWFEIYNASDRNLELAGLELAATGGKHRVSHLAIAPHTFATLGDAPADALPGYLDYGFGDDLGTLADMGSGTLALRCETLEIAAITYGDAKPGRSRELWAVDADPGDAASWCDAVTVFEPENFGTPRVASDCVPAGMCRDGSGTRAIMTPHAGDVTITEVMPSPTKVPDASGEWLELRANTGVDLNGLALDRVHDTRAPEVLASQDCMHVGAGAYVVFARAADANGGLPPLAGTFSFALVAGTASAPGDVRVLAGETELDATSWTNAPDGAALQRDDNAWCAATAPYGLGDLGTPGAMNTPCP